MNPINVDPWGPIEPLLLATGAGHAAQLAKVREIGLDNTVDALLEEIKIRFDPPLLDAPVQVQLSITCESEQVERVATISGSEINTTSGWANSAIAQIRIAVTDLLDGIFSHGDSRRHATREVIWSQSTWTDILAKARTAPQAAEQMRHNMRSALHAVLSACLNHSEDLCELSIRFGSDKWGGFHWYTKHYENHFNQFRHKPIRLLEIGIGGYTDTARGGASLGMWQRYFPRGLVYGLDIVEKPKVCGTRIRALQGDQNDPDFLNELGHRLGPFDIVIDDGSHINEHVNTSFHNLFPHVRAGGLYAIEDLQTAYWPPFGGANGNAANSDTSVGMLKKLVDGLHYEEFIDSARNQPSYTDYHVAGLHLYHNLAIIEKGKNVEGSIVAFKP